MTSYKEFRKELLNDPEVAVEYEALEPEFDIICSFVEARILKIMTKKKFYRGEVAGGGLTKWKMVLETLFFF